MDRCHRRFMHSWDLVRIAVLGSNTLSTFRLQRMARSGELHRMHSGIDYCTLTAYLPLVRCGLLGVCTRISLWLQREMPVGAFLRHCTTILAGEWRVQGSLYTPRESHDDLACNGLPINFPHQNSACLKRYFCKKIQGRAREKYFAHTNTFGVMFVLQCWWGYFDLNCQCRVFYFRFRIAVNRPQLNLILPLKFVH